MKRMILVMAFAIIIAAGYGQSRFYTGVIIGGKNVANKKAITKVTGTGNTITLFSGTTPLRVVNPDSVAFSDIAVYKKDTAYMKPGAYTSRYDFKTEPTLPDVIKAYNLLGAGIKAAPMAIPNAWAVGNNLIDRQMEGALIYITDSISAVGIKFIIQTNGAYTADQTNGVALYKVNVAGLTAEKVAESVNTGTAFSTGTGVKAISFASPYIMAPGFYYATLLWNNSAQTTAPQISYATQFSQHWSDFIGNGAAVGWKIGWTMAAQDNFPATINASATTRNTLVYFLTIY